MSTSKKSEVTESSAKSSCSDGNLSDCAALSKAQGSSPGKKSSWRSKLPPGLAKRLPKRISPFFAGIVMGGGAALVQAYFKIIPPPAYGICFVCHPKDLFNWLCDHIFGTTFGNVSVSVDVPVLTIAGILIGAFAAAKMHGEYKVERAREPIFHFITGFLVINFGLILGSCPIRIIIVSAYGSLIGIVGYICLMAGVVAGAFWLRRRARKGIRERLVQ